MSEAGWLKDRAFSEDPHVIVRHFAASAIRALQGADVIELTPDAAILSILGSGDHIVRVYAVSDNGPVNSAELVNSPKTITLP